jgi:hypothetical protein
MFRSIVVAYLNFSIPLNISGIFGIGYGFQIKHLLRPQKLVITQTASFFLGMIRIGVVHCDYATGRSNQNICNHFISSFVTCS